MMQAINQSDRDWSREMFAHIQRMEQRVMAPDSYAEPEWWASMDIDSQESYYKWVCHQTGDFCDII